MRHSEYFDAEWYLNQNQDVKNRGKNPFLHYLLFGFREGRNPSPYFDGNVYLQQNPDVRRWGMNPLVHYELWGRDECRWITGGEKATAAEKRCRIPILQKYSVKEGELVRWDETSKGWGPCHRPPFFSFIMPTYNRADWVLRAVDSLLAQNYPHYELIICDDGSSDDTEARIHAAYPDSLKDGRITYVVRPHAGCAAARNWALRLARGDWVAYLDSDNRMLDGFLEAFAACICEYPQCRIFYAQARCRSENTVIGAPFNYRRLSAGNYIDLGTVVHARSVYEQLGGFDTSLSRLLDWELLLRYTRHFQPIFLPLVLLEYNDSNELVRISNSCSYDSNAQKIRYPGRE